MGTSRSFGFQLAAAAGVAGAATAVVIGVSHFTSSQGDEPVLFGSNPATTISAPATSAAPGAGTPEGASLIQIVLPEIQPAAPVIELDYNCNLSGKGYPWLRRDLTAAQEAWMGEPGQFAGIFLSTVLDVSPYAVWLPVGGPEGDTAGSMEEVYQRLCWVHPQLGGTGLRAVAHGEANDQIYMSWGEPPAGAGLGAWETRFRDLYTDDVARAWGEPHIGGESIRMYVLPPIPQDLLDALSPPAPDEWTTQEWQELLVECEEAILRVRDAVSTTPEQRADKCSEIISWTRDAECTVDQASRVAEALIDDAARHTDIKGLGDEAEVAMRACARCCK